MFRCHIYLTLKKKLIKTLKKQRAGGETDVWLNSGKWRFSECLPIPKVVFPYSADCTRCSDWHDKKHNNSESQLHSSLLASTTLIIVTCLVIKNIRTSLLVENNILQHTELVRLFKFSPASRAHPLALESIFATSHLIKAVKRSPQDPKAASVTNTRHYLPAAKGQLIH